MEAFQGLCICSGEERKMHLGSAGRTCFERERTEATKLTLVEQTKAGEVPVVIVLEEEHLLIRDEHLHVLSRKLDRRDGSLVWPGGLEERTLLLGKHRVLLAQLLADDPAHGRLERRRRPQVRLGLELLEERHDASPTCGSSKTMQSSCSTASSSVCSSARFAVLISELGSTTHPDLTCQNGAQISVPFTFGSGSHGRAQPAVSKCRGDARPMTLLEHRMPRQSSKGGRCPAEARRAKVCSS
ncbi:hypothetical protein L1887_56049 [Cichorium endivia]|nr:hypothetical protein L1887_56049 [Cichorium endivia]